MRFRFLFLCLAGFPVLGPSSAPAQQEEQQQLEEIQRELEESQARERELEEKAERLAGEVGALTEKLITLASQIRGGEQALLEIGDRLQALANEMAAKQDDILTQNKNLAHTLAALQRLSQRPPEFILMRPAKAVETVRSASLLTTAMPELERRTRLLRDDLETLAVLKADIAREKQKLEDGLADLRAQNAALEALQREKRALYADYLSGAEQERERALRLGREARNLKALIQNLEQELESRRRSFFPSPPIPPGTSFTKARGKMPFPAAGEVVLRFGDKLPAGNAQGIRIHTLSGGQVIAPFDGRIIYAGVFRNYGQLLIIAHGDGYHTLLAGMGRIDGLVGQWVLAGEPLGIMPQTRLASTESDVGLSGPELYLEIRRRGTPVDPLPWLTKK